MRTTTPWRSRRYPKEEKIPKKEEIPQKGGDTPKSHDGTIRG
jgi:hypothetical protein